MNDEIEFENLEEVFAQAFVYLENIKQRCDAAEITYIDESSIEDEDIDIRINFPNGRDTRIVWLLSPEDLSKFSSIEFESYTVIGPYSAIYSRDENYVEAVITAPNVSRFSQNRLKRLFGIDSKNHEFIFEPHTENSKYKLSIKNQSNAVKVISGISENVGLSLKISSKEINTHDKALKILQEFSNSLFFDIEIQKKIFLSLARYNSKRTRDLLKDDGVEIQYPKNIYDSAPMDLYWYARSAVNMPLLQFLAYYQTIEYYYPNFLNLELTKKLRAIIKNPSFRVGNDTDISKIVSTIKTRRSGLGSELEQLKATLKECLDNDEISDFINSGKDRSSFFNSKAKGITSKLINLQNKGTEFYIQIAERIYDIRCKIVHTKGDDSEGEIELLLPFSKEAEKMDEDIELVRFVAQKVIICSSNIFPE